jgi:hypothetical protein
MKIIIAIDDTKTVNIGNVSQISRLTGLSRTSINKWIKIGFSSYKKNGYHLFFKAQKCS